MTAKEVKDYDLFVLSGTLSTTASPLTYYGQTINNNPWTVVTPNDFRQKIYKALITNTGSSTATVTISATNGTTTYTLAQISVPAGATESISEKDYSMIATAGYYFTASISTGSGYINALAYFSPG
jgi:hypothetical protein